MASRTVQIHLSRLCNLSCGHCYSRSGPGVRESLSYPLVVRLLADAREQGYDVAAFSGGEPFLHPRFRDIVEASRDLGLGAIAVTNGTVLKGPRAEVLSLLDLVAVSVDGPEPVHNRLRGSPTAYSRMMEGLEVIRSSGTPFGIAHTVTRESLVHLPWMAEFARSAGAEVLQLHPLGLVGFAADHALDGLDGETLARTYLTALALRVDHGDSLRIHVDLFNREQLRRNLALVVPPEAGPGAKLGDVVNPLVVLADGRVSPICHELAAAFPVADLNREALADAAAGFLARGLPQLSRFCQALAERLLDDEDGWPYLNWYELLAREAPPAPPSDASGGAVALERAVG
jgi:MoaA/NifB/PqqE/SkfB family radical SAM enzyme